MTKRERFLAIGVGVVVALFGVQFIFGKISKTLADKRTAIEKARGDGEGMDKLIVTGKIADQKLDEIALRSLPSNEELAIAQYRDWLTQLGQEVDMTGISVQQPEAAAQTTSAYKAYNFTLRGGVRLDKVFDLMGKFYDKNYLHNIRNMKMDYVEGQTYIVNLDAQALSLDAASADQEASNDRSGRLALSVDEYKQKILNRNPFAAPNNAPKIKNKKIEVLVGAPLNHAFDHEDNENHEVEYELVSEELPEGLRLRGRSLTGLFKEPGKHELLVSVMDKGWPSASREERVTIEVTEPKEEEPEAEPEKFDIATQAFVTGLTSGREGRKVWIRSRTDGKSLTLGEGDEFELGEIKAKVVNINLEEDFAQLESEGIRWIVDMDMSLADAFKKANEAD